MGTDNLLHKIKAKKASQLARRKASRERYAKVLIVCEGEKTEPRYFNSLRDHYGLSSTNVEVCGECGSDPLSVYDHAKRRYREEKAAGDPFDRVYCVFDRDSHCTYQKALDQIARATPKNTFLVTNSVPCFEYWLLLHFKYTTKPQDTCNQVLAELRESMPHYSKGNNDTFVQLIGRLSCAKNNAVRALRAAESNNTDNPSTRVYELVEFLQNIK